MTNKREYTCPYCGGKSRQPTMCDYCSAKRKIIRADRDLEEGEKVMFDDLVDWLQEYGTLNAIDECKYAANVIKGLYFGRENLRERLEISPYGEDKIDRLEAEIKNLSQELERVKQERDAAVKDMQEIMALTSEMRVCTKYCVNGHCYNRGGNMPCSPRRDASWSGHKMED